MLMSIQLESTAGLTGFDQIKLSFISLIASFAF